MARARRTRRASNRLTTRPDPATIGPLLREAGFVGSTADPVECRASFDQDGTPRRVFARYPDGWTCTMVLSRGAYSLTQSISMRVVSGKVTS